MQGTKSPWASSTMWAGAFALLALNLNYFLKVDVPEDDQRQLSGAISQIVENVLVIAAMVGRWRATKQLILPKKGRS